MEKLYLELLNINAYKTLDMAIFIKNVKSQYLWANDFFIHKSAGHGSLSEITHKNDYDFAWHEYAHILRLNDQLLFETSKSINVCERVRRHEGNYVNIVTKKSPLFDNDKNLIGLIGFSVEIPVSQTLSLLSEREHVAILLMSEGKTDKQIAKKLNISPRTVESHILNAKRKLAVKTRAELIAKMCCQYP